MGLNFLIASILITSIFFLHKHVRKWVTLHSYHGTIAVTLEQYKKLREENISSNIIVTLRFNDSVALRFNDSTLHNKYNFLEPIYLGEFLSENWGWIFFIYTVFASVAAIVVGVLGIPL